MDRLTNSDTQQLVQLLAQLEPGFLPYDVFVQIARLVVLSIIEFVPLKLNDDGEVEVLLLERQQDDPIWPGELHTPGTVIRPTDTQAKMFQAFDRILKEELQGIKISKPHYVGSNLHKSKRGMEQAQIYWIEVQGPLKIGKFYEAANLPKNVMGSQLAFIHHAVETYKKFKQPSQIH
jgi:hypothetical protein